MSDGDDLACKRRLYDDFEDDLVYFRILVADEVGGVGFSRKEDDEAVWVCVVGRYLLPVTKEDIFFLIIRNGGDKAIAVGCIHSFTSGEEDLYICFAEVDLIPLCIGEDRLVVQYVVTQRWVVGSVVAE